MKRIRIKLITLDDYVERIVKPQLAELPAIERRQKREFRRMNKIMRELPYAEIRTVIR